ncbi:MAG: Ryanodine receptor Ryr [Halochromatium sp.]|nr:Ryanodine receptor Ryr [Halochromatium sp.]
MAISLRKNQDRSYIRVLKIRRRQLILLGQGPVADACARALARGPERLIRVRATEVAAPELSKADVLVLAGLNDPLAQLNALATQLEQRRRRRPLPVLVVDDGLASTTSTSAASSARWLDRLQLEQLSVPVAAARRLLARWPLHWGADPRFGQPIHLVICGRSRFAEALLLHGLRISGYGGSRTRFTLLSEDPATWAQTFSQAYPQVHEIADVLFGSEDVMDWSDVPLVTMVVVCQPPDALSDALSQARVLAKHLLDRQQCSPPILVEIGDAEPSGELSDWDGQLIPISYRRLALDRAVLLEGRGDELARVIHEHYRDTTEAQGRDPSLEPAGRPWSTLAASYRDANRHQADHLWAKLAMTDCQAVPESQVESFAFAPIEVERLAVIEHGRWAADRWLDGWSYAPTRDNARKHHPQLIPYQQLSGPMKDLDRFAVRLVPTLLARSGLGVLRLLLVGLAPIKTALGATDEDSEPCRAAVRRRQGTRLALLMRRALTRLVARYPDRALIIAAALDDPAARAFVRIATDEWGAGFFLLLPQPLPRVLGGLDAAAGLQVLSLVARAERRILLPDPGDLERWLEQRAEILVEIGDEALAAEDKAARPKRLRIRLTTGLEWSFEY